MANWEDAIKRDTRANQPAAGIAGRLYFVTDESVLERDSGVAWEDISAVTDLTSVVAKALFGAQTILAATLNNTPAALTVGEATMVGRQTGGNISAIAQVSAGEKTAGTETALRAFTPADVKSMAETHGGGGAIPAFSGALVVRAAAQTIADNTTTAISFDTETYDEGGWYDAGAPTRLTVPAGVTRVRLVGASGFVSTTGTTGVVSSRIDKNNARFAGGVEWNFPKLAGINQPFDFATPVLSVSPGDYFELKIFQNSGTTRNTQTANPIVFLSIEAVEFS